MKLASCCWIWSSSGAGSVFSGVYMKPWSCCQEVLDVVVTQVKEDNKKFSEKSMACLNSYLYNNAE
jgi:hypothetical protein